MNKRKASKILVDCIRSNGDLQHLGRYIDWEVGNEDVTLDGRFEIDDLEAIAWWMRNTKEEVNEDGKEV